MNAIEEVIVVGIHPNDRMIEYTSPGYEDYDRFLVEMLKPFIDAKYRTLAGPSNTAVMGSSLGGVVSFYVGWQWSEVFGKIACLSSTFTTRTICMSRSIQKRTRRGVQKRVFARQQITLRINRVSNNLPGNLTSELLAPRLKRLWLTPFRRFLTKR